MRSAEYVAIVVSRYRRAIDDLVAGRGPPDAQDEEDMAVLFSRGFTGGYLSGECGPALMGRDRPDNRGLLLGRIIAADRRGLRVLARAKTVPRSGDGLVGVDCCSDQRVGFVLRTNAVSDGPDLVIPQETGCRPGMELYLTRSVRLEREAEQIIARQGPPGKLPFDIDLALTLEHDRPPVIAGALTFRDGSPVRLVREADFVPEPATSRPTPVRVYSKVRSSFVSSGTSYAEAISSVRLSLCSVISSLRTLAAAVLPVFCSLPATTGTGCPNELSTWLS